MKNKFIMATLLTLVAILGCYAQPDNKRINLKAQLQRCLDSNGDPIEGCWIHTNSVGKATYISNEDAAIALNTANAGAVDSIYVSNDTLYVVYFNAPTLAYKASGLNGIYSASNDNKNSLVRKIYYPSNGTQTLTLQTASGLGKVEFNTPFNTPMQLTNSGSGYIFYGLSNISNTCMGAYTSRGRTWASGATQGNYWIRDRTANFFPFRIDTFISQSGSGPWMYIKSNGDLNLSSYINPGYSGQSRIASTGIKNVAFFDNTGTLQLSTLSVLKDSLHIDGSATNEIQGIDNVLSQNELFTAPRSIGLENFYLDFNSKISEGDAVNFWSRKSDNTGLSHVSIGTNSSGFAYTKLYFDSSNTGFQVDAEGHIMAYPDLITGNYLEMPIKQGYGYWDNNAHDFKIGINKNPTEAIDVIGNGVISGTLSVQEIAVNNPAPTETLDVIGTGSISSTLTIGGLVIPSGNAPTNSSDTGVTGQIAWDTQYIYVCISTNNWVRSPLTGW